VSAKDASASVVFGSDSSLPTGSVAWLVREKGQARAEVMALRLATEQHSVGGDAWSLFHVLSTVLSVDMHGSHQCEPHTRGVPCHRVQHAVLADRVGGSQDSAASHLVVARNLPQQRAPHGSFVPIVVPHRQQRYDKLFENPSPRDCLAVGSASRSLDQCHDGLQKLFHSEGGGASDVGEFS